MSLPGGSTRFLPRPLRAGAVAAVGLATVVLTTGLSSVPASASPASASPGLRFAVLKNSVPPGYYFHDITGIGQAQQAATGNGLFPTTPGYDLATGIGTPEMTALITRSGP